MEGYYGQILQITRKSSLFALPDMHETDTQGIPLPGNEVGKTTWIISYRASSRPSCACLVLHSIPGRPERSPRETCS
jgi:hypothetical protein